jgi:flagellar hook-associated protein 3 FlgL
MNFRISTAYQYGSYQGAINAANTRMFEAQQRVSTGKKLNRPSDDPIGSARVTNMRALRTGIEQYSTNLRIAKGTIGTTENALSEASGLVSRAYTLAVGGANGATDQAGRNAMAEEITQIQARLVEISNSKGMSGEYLFAGQAYDTRPFSVSGTSLAYAGDNNDVVVETGPGEVMSINTKGAGLFQSAYDRLEALKNSLIGGNAGAISGVSIPDLQDSQKQFTQARGVVGTKMRRIDDLTSDMERRKDDLTKGISDVEEIDLSQAVMDYQLAQTAYQAALSVASQGFGLSLMDFIRG